MSPSIFKTTAVFDLDVLRPGVVVRVCDEKNNFYPALVSGWTNESVLVLDYVDMNKGPSAPVRVRVHRSAVTSGHVGITLIADEEGVPYAE